MKSLYNLIREAVILYIDKGIAGLSAQLSYYMLFTFFPILLFANGVLGKLLPRDFNLPLTSVIPSPIRDFAKSYINEIGDFNSAKLMFLGVILTLYSLTRYISYYRRSLGRIYGKNRRMNFIYDSVISFLFSIGMLLLFYLAVFSVFVTDSFLSAVGLSFFAESIWYMLRFIIIALYAFVVICSLHFVECGNGESFFYFAPGALCAVGIWTIVSAVFSYYAREVANYSVVYGSIGNVIMLLLWLNLTNTILLMSGVVNICLNKKT